MCEIGSRKVHMFCRLDEFLTNSNSQFEIYSWFCTSIQLLCSKQAKICTAQLCSKIWYSYFLYFL